MEYGKSFTIKDLEENQGRVVFSAPAGTGKTTAVADYIARHWKEESCVFVSQTIRALNEFEQKLLDRGVPAEQILNYNSESHIVKSMSIEELDNACITEKQIILITHARLLFDSPLNYGKQLGGVFTRKTIFIDESVNPVITIQVKTETVGQWLDYATIKHPIYSSFDIVPERNTYEGQTVNLIEDIVEYLCKPHRVSGLFMTCKGREILVSEGDKSFHHDSDVTDDVQLIRRNKNIYYVIARQIASRNYRILNDKVWMKVPISIPETWYPIIENVAILDATGYLYKGFYSKFSFFNSDNWNFDKITLHLTDKAENKSLSKTNLRQFTKEQIYKLLDTIDWNKSNRVYFVTFKGKYTLPELIDEAEKYLEDTEEKKREDGSNLVMQYCVDYFTEKLPQFSVITDEQYHEEDKIIHLSNYGRTRGSNAFRNCDTVILFGNFRYNEAALNIDVKACYPDISSDNLSLANFIQEIYRSRIRQDKPIDVYTFNDTILTPLIANVGIGSEMFTRQTLDKLEQKRNEYLNQQNPSKYQKAVIDCWNTDGILSIEGIWKYSEHPKSRDLEKFFRQHRTLLKELFQFNV